MGRFKKQKRRSVPSGVEATNFVCWADADYICARAMLLDGFLVQGAALSNTAIEKYLKAVRLIFGMGANQSHNVAELYASLKGKSVPSLNEGYLRTITKAYRLRYPDDLEPGFNLVLRQWQLLAELDASVFAIRKPFEIRRSDQREVVTQFDSWLKNSHPRLVDRNSALSPYKRHALFENPGSCYEVRVLPNGHIMEAHYSAVVADDGSFEAEALVPKPA